MTLILSAPSDLRIVVRGMPKGTRSGLQIHGAFFDDSCVTMGNTGAMADQ